MHIRQVPWQIVGAGLVALSLATVSLAPAVAASPRAHSASHAKANHAFSAAKVKCKTRQKATGTIKYSDWQFPDSLNPYQTSASVAFRTIYTFRDLLADFKPNGVLYPIMLAQLPTAKNHGISSNGKVYTFHLKPGLRWSNGKEITAADVKFGWKMGLDPKSGPACHTTCDVIRKMDTKGKYTFIAHLAHPYAPFLSLGLPPVYPTAWSSPHGSWKKNDVAAGVAQIWGNTEFNFEDSTFPTNGPYQVSDFVPQERIVLKPMKYYSTFSCGARTKQLIFAFYATPEAMIAAAANGETDQTQNYGPPDVVQLKTHKKFKTYVFPSFNVEHLTLNVDATYKGKPNPLHDVRVRQALALSLDKLTMIQSALGVSNAYARSVVAYSPLIVTKKLTQAYADKTLTGQWDPIVKKYVQPGTAKAVADAKKLLAQAGHPGGNIDIDGVTTTGRPIRAAQFSFMLSVWKKIGVNFHPDFIQSGTLFSSYDQGSPMYRGDYQIAMYTDGLSPDPDYLRTSFDSHFVDREKTTHNNVNANLSGQHDKLIDKAFQIASVNTDKKVRAKWYKVWQEQNNKNVYWLPLYYRDDISTANKHVVNYRPNPVTYEQWNAWQWAPGKS